MVNTILQHCAYLNLEELELLMNKLEERKRKLKERERLHKLLSGAK